MRGLRGAGPLIGQRVATSWRLLAVLGFGMLAAATLLAVSPVYTRVMNDLALESALEQRLGKDTRNSGVKTGLPLGSNHAAQEAAAITAIVREEISWFTGSTIRYTSLTPVTFTREHEQPSTEPLRPLIQLQTLQDYSRHIRVIDGDLARAASSPDSMEVLVPAESARAFRLQPGDRITGTLTRLDCNGLPPPISREEAAARVELSCSSPDYQPLMGVFTVTGIIEQLDPNDVYWTGSRISFSTPMETEEQGPIMMALMPEETFEEALPQALAAVPSQFQFSSYADLGGINSSQLQQVRDSIATMRERLEAHGGIADTPMAMALTDFNQRASFNQVTLLLLLLQVVGIAVYYVLLVSSLLVERRSEEIAMLRSRGASVLQIVSLAAVEALLLALLVALIAPFLASAVVSLLGLTSTFNSISDGALLPLTIVPQSFLLALAGALLAAVAVLIPTWIAARQSMVAFLRGSARPGRPWMQRYYVDVALAALAALALWQVNRRGTVFDPESVGGWSADPFLLLSPLLVILATGALLFRFLPLLLGLIARGLALTAGPTAVTLGLWQMTRSPSRYMQLALLVVMAAAVGTFAATYGETTERSQEERAHFEAGVDVRVERLGHLDRYDLQRVERELEGIEGVERASGVLRTTTSVGPLASGGNAVDLLALNPEKAADQLWFREDFAGANLSSLMARLRGSQLAEDGLDIGEARGVSLWLDSSDERENTLVWLRTIDAAGIYRLYEVTRLGFTGYQKFTVSFDGDAATISYPLRLAGLIMTQPSTTDLTRGHLIIDDIAVIDAGGAETVVEDFEGAFRWDILHTPTRTRDTLERVSQGARSGSGAARYQFLAGQTTAVRGLFFANPNIPLTAVASSSFLAANGLSIGESTELVLGNVLLPIIISGAVEYFPTMEDTARGFVIINAQDLFEYSALALQSIATRPNEAWLTLSGNEDARAETHGVLAREFGISDRDTVDVRELLTSVTNDPLVRAGGSGVLLIALVAAFAILGLGFALTLFLGGQARSLEVSVLRAVGLSPRQVFAMICLEYLLVAIIGLLVGTLAGLRISETMLGFLNVTDDGSPLLPPFALTTRWDTVAVAFAATGVAFLIGITALAGYFLRLPVSRILRVTR